MFSTLILNIGQPAIWMFGFTKYVSINSMWFYQIYSVLISIFFEFSGFTMINGVVDIYAVTKRLFKRKYLHFYLDIIFCNK